MFKFSAHFWNFIEGSVDISHNSCNIKMNSTFCYSLLFKNCKFYFKKNKFNFFLYIKIIQKK